MSVGAGVAVNGGAYRARNAGHGLDPTETLPNGEIDEGLQISTGCGGDSEPISLDISPGVSQHDSAKALVGDDQIRAAANHDHGNTGFADQTDG